MVRLFYLHCNTFQIIIIQGPKLPYNVKSSAMVSSDKYGVLIVGGEVCDGYCYNDDRHLVGNILAMADISKGWTKIDISNIDQLRKNHIALIVDGTEKMVVCTGKSKYLYYSG